MKKVTLTALLCLLSAPVLAQTTNCSAYGNSMSCQTYTQPQVNPNGCGSPAVCALQGYMRAREQGQQQQAQQQLQQERLEQLRLQNQLLQQQLDLQRQQAQLQQSQLQQSPNYRQQPMSAADQQKADDEERQLKQDIANGH